MSDAPRPERATRGRIVAVHRAPVFGPDIGDEARRIDHVENLFQAIGEVARSSAMSPVEAVLVHAPLISRALSVVVESVRRLDPAVLVYLVLDGADASRTDEALDAGFDGVLMTPVGGAIVRAVLRGEDLPIEATPAPTMTDACAVDPIEPEPASLGLVGAAFAAPPASADARPVPPTRSPVSDDAAGQTTQSRLGDIDLVETVLHDPEGLPEAALRLIAQETGWTDLRLTRADDPSVGGAIGIAPVRYGSDDHGVLASGAIDVISLTPWADWLARWMSIAKVHRDLRAMAFTDPLTGAWNRRYFDSFLPRTLEAARSRRRPVVIAVFDVDDLKLFNDRYGHETGDAALRETVRLITAVIRKGDRVCRIGGDEFVVVFADIDNRQAGSVPIESIEQIVRRFQEAVCGARLPALADGSCPGALSISAGLATYPWDGLDAESLLRVADQLALESKRKGKNTLTVGCAPREM